MVGKNAIRSMSVASITDHKTLLVNSQGRIENIASTKQILSKFVISFVPYLSFKERKNVPIVTIAATPVAHDPGPPPETHCPKKATVVTMAQISQVYIWGLVFPLKISLIYRYELKRARAAAIAPRIIFMSILK
jgi:hypothetical protein